MEKSCNKRKRPMNKTARRIKAIIEKPTTFLKQGRAGGIIMCALLAAQFFWGIEFQANGVFHYSPIWAYISFLLFIVPLAIVILATELLALIIRLIFGRASRSFLYFMLAASVLALASILATAGQIILWNIILSILVALSADILGRCIFAFVKTRKFKQVFGYIASCASLAILVLFALFFHLDCFGENQIEKYLAIDSQNSGGEIPGFTEYLANGEYEVAVIDYGNNDTLDIVTKNVDMTEFAERGGVSGILQDLYFENGLENTPVAGRIWYPKGLTNCPVMFVVHGNHEYMVPSYLGYDYLGEYLASNGYVVVSVDENMCNGLSNENDARAILLLENIKALLLENQKQDSLLYGLIDSDKITIAGHSRGGEMVATAYLFNDLDAYPDSGNIKFDYHFNISSIIAIAPTVDQYTPADHAVEISDVNYLLIHGSNDQDVFMVMGEKQYNNIHFTNESDEKHFKSSVYIMGANHGQFNTTWGQYDYSGALKGFLNTNHFIKDTEQQLIAKAYIRTFLDKTLLGKNDYETLLVDYREYANYLPRTVYITNYMDSNFIQYCSFDEDADISHGATKDVLINCSGMDEWKERMDAYGMDKNNYVLDCTWEETVNPSIEITFPKADLCLGNLSFRIADMREDVANDISMLDYIVELYDVHGNKVSVTNPRIIYPSLAVQLYKIDIFVGNYEYKHQMQTVQITKDMFDNESFDYTAITKMTIIISDSENGHIIMDDVGFQSYK